ncbi:MAG: hypothetical protein CSA18_04245 [Deltaproteobacteria bacterium]|nr:MAG: hypothetical protein CSA18_04245 [Deltaproteobacteria bacterium]
MDKPINTMIIEIRDKYGLSLAQFGSLVGAPAISVKRWEEGMKPQDRFFYQTMLVIGLITDNTEIFYDLGRHGIILDKNHWDCFANLITISEKAIETSQKLGFAKPKVNDAVVSGIKGLLALIARTFTSKNYPGLKASSSFETKIAEFLR